MTPRRSLVSRLLAAVIGGAANVAKRRPILVFRLADRVADLIHATGLFRGRFTSAAHDRARHGGRKPSAIARLLVRGHLKSRIFRALRDRVDSRHLASLVRWEDERRLGEILAGPRGAILANFHMGPSIPAVYAALVATGAPAATITRAAPSHPAATVEPVIIFDGQPEGVTRAFQRALELLRSGRILAFPVDSRFGADTPPVRLFGREIVFRRGAAALGRMTGAPIHPVGGVWSTEGPHLVTIRIGEAIAIPEGTVEEKELAVATALATWLERHLTDAPDRLDIPLEVRSASGEADQRRAPR